MKRSLYLSFAGSAVTLIGATYGLARLGYGLFLPAFSRSFELTPALSGILSSGASLLYCVAAAVGFRHAANNPRTVTVLAGLAAAGGSTGIALAPGTGTFAVAVLLAGMGAGFASPALVELVRRNTERSRQARLQSVVNSGTGFGVILAGILSLVLGDAWRIAWILTAVIAAASTLAVLHFDRGSTAARPGMPRTTRSPSLSRSSLRGLSRPLVGAFAFGIGCAAVWVYGRAVLEQAGGMSVGVSAGAWIALGTGGAAALLLAPWLADHSIPTTWSTTTLVTAGATAIVGAAPGNTVLAYLAAALFGLAYTAATSVLILWAAAASAPGASSGAGATSLLFTALVLGQAAGAPLAGFMVQAGSPFLAFSVAALICAASAMAPGWARRGAGSPIRTGPS
jgi:predicted MFS family arabinose efflux permease